MVARAKHSKICEAYSIPSNTTLPAGVAPPRRTDGNPDAPALSNGAISMIRMRQVKRQNDCANGAPMAD